MRIRISDLLRSEFMHSESDFEPNYVLTPLKIRVHRVKIVGTVRSRPIFGAQSSYARILLDDTTGVIWVSGFHTRVAMFERLDIGDMVQVVATVNEYRGRLELIAEAIAIVEPNFWLLHRAEVVRAELESRKEFEKARSILIHERNIIEAKDTAREIGLETEIAETLRPATDSQEENLGEELLSVLQTLDAEGGVGVDDLVESLSGSHGREEVETELIRLMEEGEIYEPTVGKYALI